MGIMDVVPCLTYMTVVRLFRYLGIGGGDCEAYYGIQSSSDTKMSQYIRRIREQQGV